MILGLDPIYWLFMLPGLIIGLIAQAKLKGTYSRYLNEPTASGLSGAEAAREILDRAGLQDVPVQEVPGHLTDHYDPLRKRLCLSSENYRGRSISAVGVSAHEAGHALQHKAAYAPLKLRMVMVPITNFASSMSMILIMIGLFIATAMGKHMMMAGVVLFGVVTLFQLVTLPVEFDASSRAKKVLLQMGLVTEREHVGVSRVLSAAAMTYVAAMVTAVLQLLYFLSLANRRN
ncbi:zinc metallopeptidase [bacterium]|nr:zinc metallopeptidase [bacterium]